ncbi:DUF2150 family protein [Methanospirillum sp. J.3.6.1-F.2.7.3]|uniref:DUF2150 family protein n=2 Tax=Methanospirillum TaxID=2202 RepID=A0A8E7EKQ1_9EURY|nr:MULTISPECIES: DUF2150 family protein [Methanospirillum]MDX8550621.1 DUF2150 family protein [Methanospirillum hungatei]QVV89775.1 DUF2150 family protein [Methanospirillum sp. J.3.6.1-F.2.7.3]QXO95963.1 DUF2150 family protein [Methanospirillum hungatei]
MAPRKKKDSASAQEEAPMKLFYIFYSQERWDNWINSLREADFEGGDDDEMPEGYQMLNGFNQDICIEVLKIIKLYQNNRFSKDESMTKLIEVEGIIMEQEVDEDMIELIAPMHFQLLVLFASAKKFLEGGFEEDIKALVKKGRGIDEENTEELLAVAADIGANVINGKSCCGRYIKDSEDMGVFDEWLIQIETINEAMGTLKNFDEEAGEVS